MATITDIKRRIQELAPAPFQEFCDVLISKMVLVRFMVLV